MMEKILQTLGESSGDDAKIFFVKRNKNQTTKEIKYSIFRSNINKEMGEELIKSAKSQIETTISKEPDYEEYGVVSVSDSLVIHHIEKESVPFLEDMLQEISDSQIDLIPDGEFDKIYGYIVRIENGNNALFLFRKYASKRLLEKDKIASYIENGELKKAENEIIALDRFFDAVLLLTDRIDEEEKIFIFNKSKFESLFSFIDAYRREIESKKEHLVDKNLIENVDEFIDLCSSDSRKVKKLAKIIKSGKITNLDTDQIKNVASEFSLDVEFTEDGKLKPTKENLWTILRILDDDYLKSDVTGSKYEARSKVKKK